MKNHHTTWQPIFFFFFFKTLCFIIGAWMLVFPLKCSRKRKNRKIYQIINFINRIHLTEDRKLKWTCILLNLNAISLFRYCWFFFLFSFALFVRRVWNTRSTVEHCDSVCVFVRVLQREVRKLGERRLSSLLLKITFTQVDNLFGNVISPLHEHSPHWSHANFVVLAFSRCQTDKSVFISYF